MWLDIYHSKPIFNGYTPNTGRFFPLASMDLNLISQFTQNPYVFLTFNALLVLSIGILLWIFFAQILPSSPIWRILLIFSIMLHPGFITIMLGICYPERLQILFLLLFVIASWYFYHHKSTFSAIVGVISASIALYYKEPTFLIIATFGLIMLINAIKLKTGIKTYVYYTSCIVSAGIFLGLYVWLIMPNIEQAYRREIFLSTYEVLLYTLKGLFNFILNDSPLLLLLPSLLMYRIYQFLFKKDRGYIFWDSLLLGGFLYMCVFIKLNIFEVYYLIPIYFVSFGAMLYFLFQRNYKEKIFFKVLCILCICIFCINTLPSGIYSFISFKSEGVKFHQTLSFVASIAKQKLETNQNITLYFEGNGRGEIYNTYYWSYFAQYLEQVYNVHNFDIKTKNDNSPTLWKKAKLWKHDKNSHLSIYSNDKITSPQSGNLIILNNTTQINANTAYIEKLQDSYRLIYTSEAFSVPYIGLKPLLKVIFSQSQTLRDATHGNQNLFRYPLRDYIFEVP